MKKRLLTIVSLILAMVMALGLGAAWASDRFPDVPTSSPFHFAINKIADAGITGGFADGTFRPNADITRQAMAAQLERGLSSVAISDVETITTKTGATEVVGSVSLWVPGNGGTQYVKVDAQTTLYGTSAQCPCNIRSVVREVGGVTGGVTFDAHTNEQQSIDTSWVFETTSGLHTYEFVMGVSTTDTLSLIDTTVIATTYPFDSESNLIIIPLDEGAVEEEGVSNDAGN